MDNFNTDEITRTLADTNGAPQRILRSEDEIAEIRAGRAQQQQMQSMIDNAGPAADAAQTISEIAASGQIPPPQ